MAFKGRLRDEWEGIKVNRWLAMGIISFLVLTLGSVFIPGFYAELKTWQAFIAGVVGFGGLIAAVLVSAQKQRERDDRIRDQEIIAIARAIRSEICTVVAKFLATKDVFRGMLNGENPATLRLRGISIFNPIEHQAPQMYEKCMEKIGFFPDQTSIRVLHYYESIMTISNAFKFFENKLSEDHTFDKNDIKRFIGWIDQSCEMGIEAMNKLTDYVGDDEYVDKTDFVSEKSDKDN